jgi:hypothetical protein
MRIWRLGVMWAVALAGATATADAAVAAPIINIERPSSSDSNQSATAECREGKVVVGVGGAAFPNSAAAILTSTLIPS